MVIDPYLELTNMMIIIIIQRGDKSKEFGRIRLDFSRRVNEAEGSGTSRTQRPRALRRGRRYGGMKKEQAVACSGTCGRVNMNAIVVFITQID